MRTDNRIKPTPRGKALPAFLFLLLLLLLSRGGIIAVVFHSIIGRFHRQNKVKKKRMDPYGWSNRETYPTQNPKLAVSHVLQDGSQKAVSGFGGWGNKTCPEKSGVPNCVNYMRTGACGYGVNCNFNHPKDRNSFVGDVPIVGGEYPERVGEQECKFYLRTGTCHFGMNCKFHHPRNLLSQVPLNVYGYPLRPGEKECSYYMQTGFCKFGMACKFHHPEPAGSTSVPPSAPTVYVLQSPSAPLPDPYAAVFTTYKPPRPPMLVNPYVHGPNGTVLQHATIVSLANWNAYQGVINPPLSPGAKHGVEAMVRNEGALPLPPPAFPTSYLPFGSYLKQQKLPDRPGEVHCPDYMKTGVCNYGTSCMYHHPPARVVTRMYCFLSPLGLPLRPGVQPCKFYLQNGNCKYGQNCRYDHPMGGAMQYSPSPSSSTAGGFLSGPYPMAEINFVRGRNRSSV